METVQRLLVRKIDQLDKYTLGIEWVDGHCSRWRLSHLRRHCPCAGCVDEWTGKALIDPTRVDDEIGATTIESVGQYALTVHFSDGHSTGIYSFALLRELCQCDSCAGRGSAAPADGSVQAKRDSPDSSGAEGATN